MDLADVLGTTVRRWLVTGAGGFIGSHLTESLVMAGQRVMAVDDFSTGSRTLFAPVAERCRAAGGSAFEFVEGDVGDAAVAERVMDGVDHVLHQAAIGSVPRSIEYPLPIFRANAGGFMQILAAARQAEVRSFVYASSSSVYGDDPGVSKVEHAIGEAVSPYGASKLTNEIHARVFSRCYGIRTAGLRYFNVFGPRQDPQGAYAAVIPAWIDALLSDRPVYVNGDGSTSRDFCYVDNVVQANVRAALVFGDRPPGSCGVYNVAAGATTSLLELFALLKEQLAPWAPQAHQSQPCFRPFRTGDIRHSLADIGLARRELGYRPSHSLRDGLRDALPWYVQQARSRP